MIQSPLITVMVKAAEKAARSLSKDFREIENLQVSEKAPGDFVSNADRSAEDIIREQLQIARPDWALLLEESGSIGKSSHRFIVDPLDGTTNFLHGIPHFCISIAAEENYHLSAGVIYQPITGEYFWAEKGKGAYYHNGNYHKKIRVSGRNRLIEGLIGTYVPYGHRFAEKGYENFLEQLKKITTNSAGMRRMGSSALDLAYLAAGRLDGFWEHGLHAWDVAAGIIIAKEAGAVVSHVDGSKVTFETLRKLDVIAGNEAVHNQLLSLLKT